MMIAKYGNKSILYIYYFEGLTFCLFLLENVKKCTYAMMSDLTLDYILHIIKQERKIMHRE